MEVSVTRRENVCSVPPRLDSQRDPICVTALSSMLAGLASSLCEVRSSSAVYQRYPFKKLFEDPDKLIIIHQSHFSLHTAGRWVFTGPNVSFLTAPRLTCMRNEQRNSDSLETRAMNAKRFSERVFHLMYFMCGSTVSSERCVDRQRSSGSGFSCCHVRFPGNASEWKRCSRSLTALTFKVSCWMAATQNQRAEVIQNPGPAGASICWGRRAGGGLGEGQEGRRAGGGQEGRRGAGGKTKAVLHL